MSKKVQLFGNVVTGGVFVGVITATSVNVSDVVGISSESINVTGVITATSFSGNGSGLTGVGVGTEDSINTTGIITATSFSGNGSGLTGVGVGTEDSINTSGIITASTISANEFIGSGDKLIFSPSPTEFIPIDGSTDVGLSTTISITFNQQIYAGVGSVFLRNSSGIGTVIEAIGIGSTLISGQTLNITPSSSLPINTDVYVVLPQGVITNSIGGNNALLDTYNFTTLNFAFSSIDPTNGETNVGIDTNITISFTSPPTRGTGTIELKSGSVDGPIIESFDAAASGQISISGNDWILNPSSNLGYSTSIHPIIPNGAITNYAGLNTTGADSYSFTTKAVELGDPYEGGYLICQSGGTRWVVAPSSTEVQRNWYLRGDANTRAQSVTGCTGWFIPTCGQLQNPGYTCRTYWDSYSTVHYWSNTEFSSATAWSVWFGAGGAYSSSGKPTAYWARSFRCVTY